MQGRPYPVEEELVGLKQQLQKIADGVLEGAIPQGYATAAIRALNTLARVLELQRKWRELQGIEGRLAELEQRLGRPRSGTAGRAA